jgi:hypothetical protein
MQSTLLVPTANPSSAIGISRPRPSARSLPLGLIGMILLIQAIEGSFARRTDLTTVYAADWKHTVAMIRHKDVTSSSILCFGTSLTRMGVSPRVMEETLYESVYNLALNAAQPFACYSMLRQTLEAGARPRVIVVDFMWVALAREYTFNERLIPELATLGDCVDFARTVGDSSFLGRLILARLLPSYRCRLEARDNITAALRGETPQRVPEQWVTLKNSRTNRGATHLDKRLDIMAQPIDPRYFPADWNCPRFSEIYIEKFLSLASQHNIRVFWMIPPVSPDIQAGLFDTGIQARYNRLVESMVARHSNLSVLDFSRSSYPLNAFFDPTHLNRDGAVALSRDLAIELKSQLDKPRSAGSLWAHLPRYRQDPTAGRIEDLEVTVSKLRPILERMYR